MNCEGFDLSKRAQTFDVLQGLLDEMPFPRNTESLFSYKESLFSYKESLFSYKESLFSYKESLFSYKESLFSQFVFC